MSTLTPGLKCGNKLTISCAIYRSCIIMTACLFMSVPVFGPPLWICTWEWHTPCHSITRCHNVTQCAPDDRVGSCFTRPSTLAVELVLIYWHYGLIIIASHIIVDIESNKCPWVTTAFTSHENILLCPHPCLVRQICYSHRTDKDKSFTPELKWNMQIWK